MTCCDSSYSYHEDKLVKTGGGFTYFRKDRPGNEIKSNNPSNWKIHDTSKTLKKLMEGRWEVIEYMWPPVMQCSG